MKNPKISNAKVELAMSNKQPADLPNVPDSTILKGITAVKKLVEDFQKRKNILFADDISFLLQIEVMKIPSCPKRKLRLKLPHSLVTDTSEICLFVTDLKRGKRVDHEPTIHHYEDLLKEKGITCINTVMPVRQVRVEYDQIEMRRRLLSQYDFFLADSRVSGILAHKLGSIFFNKNALPTPVKMESKDLKEEINKALHKTCIRLHGEGDTFLIKVGTGKQTLKQICENIQSVLLQLDSHFPGGWGNIRSVHVKSPQSMSIPIYITLKSKNTVQRPKVKPLHSKNEMIEGALSTVMGGRVQVYPDGRVKVVKRKGGESDDDSDEDTLMESKKPKVERKATEPEKEEKDMSEEPSDDSEDDNGEDEEGSGEDEEGSGEDEEGSGEEEEGSGEEEEGSGEEEGGSEEESENEDDSDEN